MLCLTTERSASDAASSTRRGTGLDSCEKSSGMPPSTGVYE
ncbi:hypothetical protein [Paraclostridium sordellii]|nr:hypothetical protein [Paeniclostridium sordellii]